MEGPQKEETHILPIPNYNPTLPSKRKRKKHRTWKEPTFLLKKHPIKKVSLPSTTPPR